MPKNDTDPKIYDRRILERNLKSGTLDRKEYERYLKALDDDADNIKPVETVLGEGSEVKETEGSED
jgi:hypothetical protein